MTNEAGAGSGDEQIEYEHEVVELGAPFAQVFGPEIVDSNLKDFEFRLLVYLRMVAARNGHTWVSHRRIAQYLGKDVRSVQRAYSELKKKGFTRSQRRGMGKTNKKYLVAPSSIYGPDRMRHFFGFLRADTSDKDIAHLRRLDSSNKSSSDKNVPTEDGYLDSSNKSSSDKNVPQVETDLSPKSGQKCVPPEVDQAEVDLRETDQEIGGAGHHTPSDRLTDQLLEEDPDQGSETPRKTKGDQARDYWKNKPHDEESRNPSDEERMAAVRATVAAKEEQARPEAVLKSLERSSARKGERTANTTPDSDRVSEKTRQRHKGKDRDGTGMDTQDLKKFYEQTMEDFLPGERYAEWEGGHLALAKPLLEDFGWNLTTQVILDVCKNWPEYRGRMKCKSSFPALKWIYACRNQLFGEMQLKIKKPEGSEAEEEWTKIRGGGWE